jgi:type II secretory pathway pseudopilin PulG
MTLLELTVVLMILIALAGLMIPYFDRSIATRTDDSTSVSSLAEVDKWMQSYNSIFMKEPNNMEALINGTAGSSTTLNDPCNPAATPSYAAANVVYCKMIQPAYFGTTTVNTAGSVDEDKQRALSLTMAGITSVYYNDPNTTDATFNSTIAGDPTPIDDGSVHTLAKVVLPAGGPVTEAYLATVFGTTADKFDVTCYDYIAFGIGNGSSLTGKLMSSAPVQYIAESDAGPARKYNRFVAIYQVDKLAAEVNQGATNKGCSPGTESARYIGSVIAGDRYAGRLMGLVHTQGQTHKNIN